ncbi:MAG: ribbon-helix-helix domain-containing protein [Candidatus Aminicenantaceae bacterium]
MIIKMRQNQLTKINISIPQEILDEIDRVSKEENKTRSELLRMAFKIYLDVLKEERREKKKQKSIEKAIQIHEEIHDEIGNIDLIQELRKWRDERKNECCRQEKLCH